MLVRFAGPRLAAGRRRPRAGQAAPRRPHPRRQPELGSAAAACRFLARRPVRRHAGARRRHGQPPGAGRAGRQLPDRTWATLADGTPLVTAERRGKGLIVLFHVTADTRWSNLPLSGAFVEMLKRIVTPRRLDAATTDAKADRESGRAGNRAADPHARRLRRVRPAAPTARPVPQGFSGRARRRPSARLLWSAGRFAGRQHARAERPACGARLRPAQCAARNLPRQRAAGPARTRSAGSAWRCC